MRVVVVVLALAACGPAANEVAFGFVGEVADPTQRSSVIGLFVVSSSPPTYYYKLGDGGTVGNQFQIELAIDPPPEARNADGIGIALLALLPGISTVPDGIVVLDQLRLGGVSPNHAIIYLAPDAAGPTWSQEFPPGFSCVHCVPAVDPAGLATFEPTPCDFVVIQSLVRDHCAWY